MKCKINSIARYISMAALCLSFAVGVQAQSTSMRDMPGMEHHAMSGSGNEAETFLMGESSGTGFQPQSWAMPMVMSLVGDWNLMWMGQAFVVDTQQSSPRGHDKLYSANWGMLGAMHKLAGGAIMLRSMMSLEPATVADRRYPLLFQVGETAYGKPIVDAQHPHNLFMEIAVQYAHLLGENATWNLYYAPVGDPALGPVAYPHRASATELPEATIGHHWEDSTHISDNVVTAGLSYRKMRIEASGFYGREPGENRWTIGYGPMDSWATRLSFFPARNWAAQVSVGRLHDPEALQPGDEVRTTSSIEYTTPRAFGHSWATALIWGQDYRTAERHRTNTVTGETVLPFARRNFLTGRYEWSQRDELFANDPALAAAITRKTGEYAFSVNALTAGYTRDVNVFHDLETGVGANVSSYFIEKALQPYYGAHPWGLSVFVRFRVQTPRG